MGNLTCIDMFAGIGGFRLGMERAGHTCVGYIENDKYAIKSYQAMHHTRGEYHATDIRTIKPEDLPEADVYSGGFPCQSFSSAGKRLGFEDTRGMLVFEIFRLAKIRKPKILFLENVKGLLNHDKGRTFATILLAMDELGYDVEWQLFNSKNYVPQNRERIFIIGHLRGGGSRKIFPIEQANKGTLKQLIGGSQGYRVYNPEYISCTLASQSGGMGAKTGLYIIGKDGKDKKINNKEELASTLTAGGNSGGNHSDMDLLVSPIISPNRKKVRQNGRRMKEAGEDSFTLTSQDRHGIWIKEATKKGYSIAKEGDSVNVSFPNSQTRRGRVGKSISNTLETAPNMATIREGRIRRLTPKECFRLQGFPDELYEKARLVNSDTQLYKQAGNAVTVNVVEDIARRF